MKANSCLIRLMLSLVLLSGPSAVLASPLPPCVRATLSANAQILVLNDLTCDKPKETNTCNVRTSTFHILQHRAEVNDSMRLDGPDTYWSDPLWSVLFDKTHNSPIVSCPYTLVTNDGEFLILLGNSVESIALRIYRRRDHPGQPFGGPGPDHGVLVREIPLAALWPADRIPTMIFDSTPQWFASGTFAFSPDNRTLTHTTRWGTTLKINLIDGAVVTH